MSGPGSGAPGTSSSSSPSSLAKRRSSSPRRIASSGRSAKPGEARDVLARRRAEGGEVAAHEVRRRAAAVRRRPDPVLGEREPVRAAALPRPRRRHPHEVDPQPAAERPLLPHQRVDLRPAQLVPAREPVADRARRAGHRGRGEVAAGAQPRGAAHVADRERERPEVARATRGGSSSASASPGRRCGPRARASGRPARSPASRDHSPMYIDGAYCDWIPQTASSAAGSGSAARSSRSWRASSARLSSRRVSVRTGRSLPALVTISLPSRGGDIRPRGGRHHAPWPASRIAPYILLGIRTGRAIRQPRTAALLPRGAAVVVPPVQSLLAPGPFRCGPRRARLPGPDERSRPE